MNTPPVHQNDPQQNVELRLRTMRTLWIAMVLSIAGYVVLTVFAGRPEGVQPNNTLFLVFTAATLSTTLLSFLIKDRLVTKAIEQEQVPMVQQAYVVAWAITEVGALLGVLDFFTTGDRYYYVLFLISGCGQLLHFPRREHVINASPTTRIV